MHSRVNSSINERMRRGAPSSVRSATKSQLQTWLGCFAVVGILPVDWPRRRCFFFGGRTHQPLGSTDLLHKLTTYLPAFTHQQGAYTTVAITGMFLGDSDDGLHHTYHFITCRFCPVTVAGPVQAQVTARGPPGAQAFMRHFLHCFAFLSRAYHFFAFTASSTRMLSI